MKRVGLWVLMVALAGCAITPRVTDPYRGSPQAARDLVMDRLGNPDWATVSPIDMTHADEIVPVTVQTDMQRCLFIIGRDRTVPPYGWVVIDRSTKCDDLR